MQRLSKIIVFLFILFLSASGVLFFQVNSEGVLADLEVPEGKVEDPDPFPQLKYPCDEDGLNPEFNSLRPYQAAPCGSAPLARFCSNELVFIETFELARKGDCQPIGVTRSFTCNPDFHVDQHDLYIELSGSELPILGNTEQVTNSQGGTEEFDDAQKLNEYASWYLSGVNSRAEYGEATDDQVVNFSGPLNKLLPLMIGEAERINTINKTGNEVAFTDDTGTSDDGSATSDTSVETHNQIVVCANKVVLGLFGKTEAKSCPDGKEYRLEDWNGDLSFLRGLLNTVTSYFEPLVDNIVGGDSIGTEVGSSVVEQDINDVVSQGWNKRYPPLPWADENGNPFNSNLEYQKAYNEWQGKSCAIVLGKLLCIDNPLITNEYADLYHYIPLSSTADKKGANYIMGDGPSYTGGAGTKIENDKHSSFSGAPLYFAHTQEVRELSSLLNTTYQPEGFEDSGFSKDVEVIKKGSKPVASPLPPVLSPDKQNPPATRDPYGGMDCSLAQVRINQGDNLFAGDKGGPYEMWVRDVEYDITEVECDETFEPATPTGCGPNNLDRCPAKRLITCPAYIEISIKSAVKAPNLNEIFKQTVAGTGSTLRKIFPKIGEGAPIECIADIPTSTDVYYDPTQSEEPVGPGSDISFKVRQNPDDGTNVQDQLTFPHVGSVYEYFLKGIQTALRPKGYGEPIANGNCKPIEPMECGAWEERLEKSSGGDCGVCTSGLGDLAKRILTTAGKAYNVPAASIWAAMKHEGGDWDEFRGQFTDENVRKWSTPIECGGEPMPLCDPYDQSGSKAYAPFGFLPYWFYKGEGTGALWNAVSVFEPTRDSVDRVSHCNFLDAAFASAKSLATWSGFARTPPFCYKLNLGMSDQPASCRDWEDYNVVQSHVGYWIGTTPWCPDGTGGPIPSDLGSNIAIPDYASRVLSDFNSAKCN